MGGGSILVDGFRVAEEFRKLDPDGFGLLSTVDVEFRFHDEQVDLGHAAPVIALNSRPRQRQHGGGAIHVNKSCDSRRIAGTPATESDNFCNQCVIGGVQVWCGMAIPSNTGANRSIAS